FRLMTTFFNYENPEVFGITSYMPEFPVSSIVDNIILMNLVELGNSIHRGITVVKARGSNHEFDTREFTIWARWNRIKGSGRGLAIDTISAVPELLRRLEQGPGADEPLLPHRRR